MSNAANDLNITTSGYCSFNSTNGVFAGRTFQAGTGISLTNADGISGNTTISSTVAGATSTTYVSTTPYNVLLTDDVILVDTATIAAPSAVNLLANGTTDGRVWTIKDWSGAAAAHNITVSVTGGANIDGSATFVLNENYQAVSICWSVSRSTYSVVYDYPIVSGIAITTIQGDTGSITGATVKIYADRVAVNSGGTVYFTNSGTTSTLSLTDSSNNTLLGNLTGNTTLTGQFNSGVGTNNLSALTTGSHNQALGSNALKSLTTGQRNIAVGFNALTTTVSANDNIGIGDLSARVISSGTRNICMGSSSLTAGTTCSDTIAIGYRALVANTTTSQQIAIGSNALASSIADTGNMAIGFNALANLNANTLNLAIGESSLQALTSGFGNVAVGYQSLFNETGGNGNTAIGESALFSFITGSQNTGVGGEIFYGLTTGQNNTGIGNASLYRLTTGSDNSCLGQNIATSLVTGSNNTLLGYGAGSSYTTSESSNVIINNPGVIADSNTLRIGTADGTGTQQLNNAYIYGIVPNSQPASGSVKFVTINSSGGASNGLLGVTSVTTSTAWSDKATGFTAAAANGYFITAALTATLPASPSEGDTITFAVDNAGSFVVQANTGQTIRIGSVTSTVAGTATNTARGDAVTLVYRSAATTWISVPGIQGTWILA